LGRQPSPDIEIGESLFLLYLTEFRKPLTKYENELRRHLDMRPLSGIGENEFTTRHSRAEAESQSLNCGRIMALSSECPEKHGRRFRMRYVDGYGVSEIAGMEGCSRQSVFNSIEAVKRLVKSTYGKNTEAA
jgi:DNA-directed RNA polymerase specialized sigma24 family protein